jgi:hypothetical protein
VTLPIIAPPPVVNRISVCPISGSINGWRWPASVATKVCHPAQVIVAAFAVAVAVGTGLLPLPIAREGPGCHRRPQSVASWGGGFSTGGARESEEAKWLAQ